jgi:hypothetical protein
MIKISVNVDSEILEQLANRMPGLFGEGVAPETQNAFSEAAKVIQKTWKDWAMGGTIEGIPNIRAPNQKLATSIKIKQNGPFDVNIETASPYAKRIQEGTPELDMKTTHPYGRKSRVSKRTDEKHPGGIPYLIVPFRWGTPNKYGEARAHFGNVIPQSLFTRVKAFKTYKRLAKFDKEGNIIGGQTHFERNYDGIGVERSEYNQDYDRLDDVEGNERGMVRMAKGGGYFTFRIISAAQIVTKPWSWIRKAVPPVDVVGALKTSMQPVVEGIIQAGLEADFEM